MKSCIERTAWHKISTVGECKIYLEDFMPYDLMLEESNDFDKRIKKCDESFILGVLLG